MTKDSPRPAIRLSWQKKTLFGLIVTVMFFALMEAMLTVVGVAKSTDNSDPYVGFSSQIPLLEKDVDEHVRTAGNKLVWFNEQRFPIAKPANTRRVFCVGGSTTFGRPYADSTSFCGWLREFLPIADSSTEWEVINAGGVSYASYRVAAVMEELAQYDPDLFIVYSGQNEFLERRTYANFFAQSSFKMKLESALSRTRTWSLLQRVVKPQPEDDEEEDSTVEMLPGEVNEMLNHTVGPEDYHRDDQWRSGVLAHYRLNLKRMIRIAEDAGAKIVFVVPASNEADCSPFKSEVKANSEEAATSRFRELQEIAKRHLADGNAEKALKPLKEACEIDPQHADVSYRLGKTLFATGEQSQAQVAFQNALDHDVCPLRAPSDFIAAVTEVAIASDVSLVDFSQRLRDLCREEHGHAILGKEYFLDHVHPTIDAHKRLSLWIIERLLSDRVIDGRLPSSSQIDDVERGVLGRVDEREQAVAMRNLAKVLHWAGKFDEAIPRAEDALATIQDDPESLLVLADCLRQTERVDEAIVRYERLIDTSPMYLRAYAPYGELLLDLEQYPLARDVLSMAMLAYPVGSASQIRAQYFMAIAMIEMEDYEGATPLLEDILAAYPKNVHSIYYLARSREGTGKTEAAISLYEDVIGLDPDFKDSRMRLVALQMSGQ